MSLIYCDYIYCPSLGEWSAEWGSGDKLLGYEAVKCILKYMIVPDIAVISIVVDPNVSTNGVQKVRNIYALKRYVFFIVIGAFRIRT